MITEAMQQLPGSPGCVICDNNNTNPRSLHVRLWWNEENETVHIPCVPDETWCGYSAIVHGGMVASLLDEAMAWVVRQVSDDWAFTADYHIRYKKPVVPGREYVAIASVESLSSRKILAEARFLDPEGNIAAQASAVFLPAKGRALPRS